MWTRLASSVDEALNEDEMAFSEPLKEYLHFSEVLKWVCNVLLIVYLKIYVFNTFEWFVADRNQHQEKQD